MNTLILNTAYFPPIQYFSKIKNYPEVRIEQYEHYGKQSYRNRFEILSANGVLPLSVPVKKPFGDKTLVKDIEVDYAINWQKQHFKGIESAYKNSPFYDYYMDEFQSYFEKKEKFLLELNGKILHQLLEILDINRKIGYTTEFEKEIHNACDMRDVIHPKASRRKEEDTGFQAIGYQQTFSEKFPFIPNLSILDLLFNTGPEATDFL